MTQDANAIDSSTDLAMVEVESRTNALSSALDNSIALLIG